jgi:5-methylthioadenosine/S-adenosylhomocysteine deaminase
MPTTRQQVTSTICRVTIPAGGAGPARPLLIRGGHVLTMDPATGDLPAADVLVDAGQISAVGPGLAAPPGAEVLDATGMIVAPGLVDTHWHMWNTLLRSMSGPGYFRVSAGLGQAFTAADVYQGTLLACAEAISSGITTVHDWCHNVRSPAHAAAALAAHATAGLRARFSYGCPAGHPATEPMDLAGLRALHQDWGARACGGRLSLGLAWRGPGGHGGPLPAVPEQIYRAEIGAARELGLPVTVHISGSGRASGQIAALASAGLLGPDLQVVHANGATSGEIAQLAAAGATVTVSPFSELLIGYGLPRTGEFLAAGIPVGLSVDTTALAGNADMFAIMKVTQALANGQAGDEFALTARQALALATCDGARSLGLGGQTGSLTPGKRADLILVDPAAANLCVLTDPVHLLVTAAQPANVDTVLVDGRVLKRGGQLTTIDLAQLRAAARAALAGVRARATAPAPGTA